MRRFHGLSATPIRQLRDRAALFIAPAAMRPISEAGPEFSADSLVDALPPLSIAVKMASTSQESEARQKVISLYDAAINISAARPHVDGGHILAFTFHAPAGRDDDASGLDGRARERTASPASSRMSVK